MALSRIRIRKPASITSLIDVIFLLLLFFMLASSFSRQAEIELVSSSQRGGQSAPADVTVLRLSVSPEALTLNDESVSIDTLIAEITKRKTSGRTVLAVDPAEDTTTQRMIDTLLALRELQGVDVQIVEPAS